MALGFIDNGVFSDIATAIRGKTGSSGTLKPSNMASAIENIPAGLGTTILSISGGHVSHYTTPSGQYVSNAPAFNTIQVATNTIFRTLPLYSDYTLYCSGCYAVDESDRYFVCITSPASITFEECCFIQGTQVYMADGTTKNIEDVVTGDKVISYNIDTNENYITEVKKLIINNNTTDIAEITLENGDTLTMNAYHPIYTDNGWCSLTNYNSYNTLEIDNNVKVIDGYSKIVNINRYESEPIITYNLDVKDIDEDTDIDINDNFYANGIMVHNAACPT